MPKTVIADAGYGSEENFLYAVGEEKNLDSTSSFHTEKTRSYKKNIRHAKNWDYNEQDLKVYECEDCSDCPLKAKCTKAKGIDKCNGTPFLKK